MNNQGVQVNPIRANVGDGVDLQSLRFVNENPGDHGGSLLGDALRVKNQPETMLHVNYSVNFNTIELEGPMCYLLYH